MKQHRIKYTWILAALYALAMLILLFYRKSEIFLLPYSVQLREHFNPYPFRTIQLYIHCLFPPKNPSLVRLAIINLVGNVVLFIPLGLFPALLWSKMRSLRKTLLLSAGIMLIIEPAQMFLVVGTCDIDDLILNLVGAAIGYGLYKTAKRLHG